MKPGLMNNNQNDDYFIQTPIIRRQANARERNRTHRFIGYFYLIFKFQF